VNVSSYYSLRDKTQSLESLGALTGSIKNLGAEKGWRARREDYGLGFSPAVFQCARREPALGASIPRRKIQVDNWAPSLLLRIVSGSGFSTAIQRHR